jgi:hypothetical protein
MRYLAWFYALLTLAFVLAGIGCLELLGNSEVASVGAFLLWASAGLAYRLSLDTQRPIPIRKPLRSAWHAAESHSAL